MYFLISNLYILITTLPIFLFLGVHFKLPRNLHQVRMFAFFLCTVRHFVQNGGVGNSGLRFVLFWHTAAKHVLNLWLIASNQKSYGAKDNQSFVIGQLCFLTTRKAIGCKCLADILQPVYFWIDTALFLPGYSTIIILSYEDAINSSLTL